MTATVFHTRQDAQDPQLTERNNDMTTTTTDTRPVVDPTPPAPSANPYEGGRMMTTVKCPSCEARVTVAVADLDGLARGSVVVMHAREHWTRAYSGADPARAQYRAGEWS